MTDRHIAIIGGGASAALLLAQLAKRPGVKGWSVDVYDRTERFGQGVAYSTTDPAHLLNVRSQNMSVYADKPDDFAQWSKQYGYGPLDFAPRALYAIYLARRMEQALKVFSSVQLISADVTDSRKIGEGHYEVEARGGHKSYTDVIVATGNVRALAPKVEGDVPAYHAEPWGLDYDGMAGLDHIVLIGTGLSAVDVIQSLNRVGYLGTITTVSRNGLFPAVHAAPENYAGFDTKGLSPSGLMRELQIRVAQSDGSWQAVVDSLRPMTNTIWQGWSPREKDIFLRRALTMWNIHRHRMAPVNDEVIRSLRQQGKLQSVKDSVAAVTSDGVVCKRQILQADAVINCMGYRYDEGRMMEGSYRIGPARFGELFETTAIPEIRAQAAEISKALTTH